MLFLEAHFVAVGLSVFNKKSESIYDMSFILLCLRAFESSSPVKLLSFPLKSLLYVVHSEHPF